MKTDLIEIFQTIRAVLQPYASLGFNNRVNSETAYDLWSDRSIIIEGIEKNELQFASVVIHEDYVGFYFMPVYAVPEMREVFDPAMLKLLKGETCFHIKQLDDLLLDHIENALAEGYRLYKAKGWV